VTAASYNNDVVAYMNNVGCNQTGCHASGSGLPGPWSDTYWTNNAPINYCSSGSPPNYIVSGNPNGSLIYQVLNATACSSIPRMPEGASAPTAWKSGTNVSMFYQWINAGADGSN
jgi:hypothetical protein